MKKVPAVNFEKILPGFGSGIIVFTLTIGLYSIWSGSEVYIHAFWTALSILTVAFIAMLAFLSFFGRTVAEGTVAFFERNDSTQQVRYLGSGFWLLPPGWKKFVVIAVEQEHHYTHHHLITHPDAPPQVVSKDIFVQVTLSVSDICRHAEIHRSHYVNADGRLDFVKMGLNDAMFDVCDRDSGVFYLDGVPPTSENISFMNKLSLNTALGVAARETLTTFNLYGNPTGTIIEVDDSEMSVAHRISGV